MGRDFSYGLLHCGATLLPIHYRSPSANRFRLDTVVVGILRGYGMYGTGLSLSIERQCYRADLDAEKTGEEER